MSPSPSRSRKPAARSSKAKSPAKTKARAAKGAGTSAKSARSAAAKARPAAAAKKKTSTRTKAATTRKKASTKAKTPATPKKKKVTKATRAATGTRTRAKRPEAEVGAPLTPPLAIDPAASPSTSAAPVVSQTVSAPAPMHAPGVREDRPASGGQVDRRDQRRDDSRGDQRQWNPQGRRDDRRPDDRQSWGGGGGGGGNRGGQPHPHHQQQQGRRDDRRGPGPSSGGGGGNQWSGQDRRGQHPSQPSQQQQNRQNFGAPPGWQPRQQPRQPGGDGRGNGGGGSPQAPAQQHRSQPHQQQQQQPSRQQGGRWEQDRDQRGGGDRRPPEQRGPGGDRSGGRGGDDRNRDRRPDDRRHDRPRIESERPVESIEPDDTRPRPASVHPEPIHKPVPPTPHPDHHHTPAGPDHPGRDEIFERQTTFADLGLRSSVLKGVTEAGFEHPTTIQAKIIPVILSGKDVLGQAKTGTGKTAAFGLPLLHRIEKGVPFSALVLVPTRELAIQVATDLRELGRFTPLNILPVYGGQNVKTQAQLLSKGPEIIVATPGRVMDMVQRGFIHYRNIKMVVLDEVDRMLDIGFRDDIRRILGGCPRDRQTVFVSATISPEVESLARSFARDCEKLVASTGSLTVAMVKQWHLPVAPWDKKALLLHLLTHEDPALTVVFCRTKKTVDNVAEYLQRKGVDCHAIHGDMYQNKRNKVMEQLRSGKLEVLVASDVASRGLDVEGITHVINYDLPEDPDLYVHRIGRTARAGRDGVAWSLVTPEQGGLLTQIELLINAEIPKLDYPDFKPGPVPQHVLESQMLDAKRAERARQFNRFSAVPAPAVVPPAAAGPGAVAHVASYAPADADPARFPGGIVPTKAPPKRMFGKVKTARSMKQAIQQTLLPGAPATPPAPVNTDPTPEPTPEPAAEPAPTSTPD